MYCSAIFCFVWYSMTNDKTSKEEIVTRFAPSPTGYLHLGHAYSAIFAHDLARDGGGRFLLRIEDIDLGRRRPEFVDAILEDLAWLGLTWDGVVRHQSNHFGDYRQVLLPLMDRDLVYPCFCTRKEIQGEIAAAGQAPHGPDGLLYPGTCRHLGEQERKARMDYGESYALRLDMELALKEVGDLTWIDVRRGPQKMEAAQFGDVVLARKDTPTSYHLAVTLDDHLQGVTLVTRGEDLFPSTHVHRLLQALLGFATPTYHHHGLLVGDDGRRFAKRDRSLTLRTLREEGHSANYVRKLIAEMAPD